MTGGAPQFGQRSEFYTFAPETLAQELPEFTIQREVGKGSMGIVYDAVRKQDNHRVALKVLPPSLTLTERALARFLREAELMEKVSHPAIVRALEHGKHGRLHYFVMEFVDGVTLEQRVKNGPLPARHAAEIGAQVARALHFAHERGIVHRDIKPGNLMLREDGSVVITDFGLARETGTGSLTESGAIVGTPIYMPPEQVLGERGGVGTKSDVYGLGATLYQLVTGSAPFQAETAQGVLKAVLEHDPQPASALQVDLPTALESVIHKAMEKEPARRYGTALEIAEEIERWLDGARDAESQKRSAAAAVQGAKGHLASGDPELAGSALHDLLRAVTLDPDNHEAPKLLVEALEAPTATLPKEVEADVTSRRAERASSATTLLSTACALALVPAPLAWLLGLREPSALGALGGLSVLLLGVLLVVRSAQAAQLARLEASDRRLAVQAYHLRRLFPGAVIDDKRDRLSGG